MKKLLIGAIVGGFIAFAWQTLSHTALNLHRDAEKYTPKQDSILAFLSTQLSEDGDYFLPTYPTGASNEEIQKIITSANGKPWAKISYHRSWDTGMAANIIRGLLVTIIMALMLTWILMRLDAPSFTTILTASIFVGLIGFLNFPYANFTWYKSGGIWADMADAVVMWGACGAWLGWWLRKKDR